MKLPVTVFTLPLAALILPLAALFLARAMADGNRYADRILAADPEVFWEFGDPVEGWIHEKSASPGSETAPLPPEFPLFDESNRALDVSEGGYVRIPDRESLRFSNGDAMTIEAWVNIQEIQQSANVYIAGKGRTHHEGYPKDNQNWALRLRDSEGYPSFLFTTLGDDGEAVYHRWTARDGVMPGSGWHHVAVSYEFGFPKSAVGYVDGRKVEGEWDLGGATELPPVQGSWVLSIDPLPSVAIPQRQKASA